MTFGTFNLDFAILYMKYLTLMSDSKHKKEGVGVKKDLERLARITGTTSVRHSQSSRKGVRKQRPNDNAAQQINLCAALKSSAVYLIFVCNMD